MIPAAPAGSMGAMLGGLGMGSMAPTGPSGLEMGAGSQMNPMALAGLGTLLGSQMTPKAAPVPNIPQSYPRSSAGSPMGQDSALLGLLQGIMQGGGRPTPALGGMKNG